MSREKDLRDLATLQAISGSEDPSSTGMNIVEGYFIREEMENRREQGFDVPEEYQPSSWTQREKDAWKHQKWFQEMEQARTNRPELEYPGKDDEEVQVERKEMSFVDTKLFDVILNTHVNIKQSRKNPDSNWFTVITVGKKQDKVILVGTRKDGKGTYLLTDWPEYMKATDPEMTKKEVIKV